MTMLEWPHLGLREENDMSTARVGVYLGANMGSNPTFEAAAKLLGKGLAESGHTLVYGGGSVGLMGTLATTVKQYGGKVIGIITEHLIGFEKPFADADELHIVKTMYERKRMIHDHASSFVILPGGIGTFDELFETWCAIKNGVMQKPISFVNIDGFFNDLFKFVDSCRQHGFLDTMHQNIPKIYDNMAHCLNDLHSSQKNCVA